MPNGTPVARRVREYLLRNGGEYTTSAIAHALGISSREAIVAFSHMYASGELRRRAGGRSPANGRLVWIYTPVRGALTATAVADTSTTFHHGFDAHQLCRVLGTIYRGEPPRGRVHRMDVPVHYGRGHRKEAGA
jgi:hypothetical protein